MIAPLQSSPSHNSSSTTIANEQAPSSHRGDESAILRSLSLNTRALLAAPHMERSRSLPERGSPNGEQSWSTFPPSRTAEHTRKTPSQQRILLHSQSTNTSASSGSEANAVEAGSSNSKRGEKRLKKSSSATSSAAAPSDPLVEVSWTLQLPFKNKRAQQQQQHHLPAAWLGNRVNTAAAPLVATRADHDASAHIPHLMRLQLLRQSVRSCMNASSERHARGTCTSLLLISA